jgi:hypothetical protein
MRASSLMFFGYLGMIGVPVLLFILVVSGLVLPYGVMRSILFLLIGAGSLLYGAIGIREVYIHGGKKRERGVRRGNKDD